MKIIMLTHHIRVIIKSCINRPCYGITKNHVNFHVQKTLISFLKPHTDYLNKNNIYYIKTRISIVDSSTALITDNKYKTILFGTQILFRESSNFTHNSTNDES